MRSASPIPPSSVIKWHIVVWLLTPLLVNLIAVIAQAFLALNFFPEETLARLTHFRQTHTATAIFMELLSFGVPLTLISIYTKIMVSRLQLDSDRPQATMKKDLGKRQLLNYPLINALLGTVGWLVGITGAQLMNQLDGLDNHARLLIILYNSFNAFICFVLGYYILDFFNRRYVIPFYFPENQLSQVSGVIKISVMTRFYIFFMAIAVFPLYFAFLLFFFKEAFNPQVLDLTFVTLSFLALIAVTLFLTFLYGKSFQIPLRHLAEAVNRIAREDFQIKLPVRSRDELGYLGEGINQMARELKEKELIKETFGKLVDPQIRDHLLSGELRLGGELLEATILFADIRNFTWLSEGLPPEQIVSILNRFFERMGSAIINSQGLVNKFIGDAILAIFGAPLPLPEHALRAVEAAIAMRWELAKLNELLLAEQYPPLRIGIGIHTGRVLAGNIGSSARMEYTVIGDPVNVASRLQSLSTQFDCDILISQATRDLLPATASVSFIDNVHLKGKEKSISVWKVTK